MLTDADLKHVEEVIYAKTGMRFGASRRGHLEKRVSERMRATKKTTIHDYLTRVRLREDGSEIQKLINAVTVNETYFFREDYQFRCLTRSLLPELARNADRKTLRLWSLPCSTGEEAYSIAIQLLEHFSGVDDYEIEIVGSDIDTDALHKARHGVYSARSLQHVPRALVARYFERKPRDTWRVCEGLRDSILFKQASIVDRPQMLKGGLRDVIFCRNLLIYFDDAARRCASDNTFEALRPGGFVCLGHSESMSRISERFKIRKFEDAIVYQRP